MRRWIVFVVLLVLCFATPVAFGETCVRYWDSQAASYYGESFCWLSGRICYECYDDYSGENCSTDWSECNPYPSGPEHQRAFILFLEDGEEAERGCVAAVENATLSAAALL